MAIQSTAVAFAANGCADPLTLCLWSDGSALSDAESIPHEALGGDIFTVKIFVTAKEQRDGVSATVTSSQRKSPDTLFGPSLKQELKELREAKRDNLTEDDALILDNAFVLSAVAEDVNDLVIQVSQTKANKPTSVHAIHMTINRGRSYYSIAFLVAATYRGERTIHRDLTATSDTSLESGFALNVFPGGRRRGVIGYLVGPHDFWRGVADTVGLQFGTDLDLTNPFDRVFAGAVFEPVAGLAFSAGVSVRQVAFVPPDSDHPGQVTGTTAIPTEQGRVIRPYLGITITFDLLDTIAKVKAPSRSGG